MLTIFHSWEQARASLAANRFDYTGRDGAAGEDASTTPAHELETQDPETHDMEADEVAAYLDDYARIAAFLCDEDRFMAALEGVSMKIWQVYLSLAPGEKNKFTRALGAAARAAGFDFQNRVPLDDRNSSASAPIGIKLVADDPGFVDMLRKKLFWKDSVDLRHGEHSHSLQWLAIAEGARTVKGAAELYSHSGDFHAPARGKSEGAPVLSMWQWLVDCFPSDLPAAAGDAAFLNGEQLVSDGFRSPHHLMDRLMLMPPGERERHFVASYLHRRYQRRGWLVEEGGMVSRFTQGDLQQHGVQKGQSPAWDTNPTGPASTLLRAKGGTPMGPASVGVARTFHSIEGVVYQK